MNILLTGGCDVEVRLSKTGRKVVLWSNFQDDH
jgi:hypothetical protein